MWHRVRRRLEESHMFVIRAQYAPMHFERDARGVEACIQFVAPGRVPGLELAVAPCTAGMPALVAERPAEQQPVAGPVLLGPGHLASACTEEEH